MNEYKYFTTIISSTFFFHTSVETTYFVCKTILKSSICKNDKQFD